VAQLPRLKPRPTPPLQQGVELWACAVAAAQQQPEGFAQWLQGLQRHQTRLTPGRGREQGEMGGQEQAVICQLLQPDLRLCGSAVLERKPVASRQSL
jgi:hypothetical protein